MGPDRARAKGRLLHLGQTVLILLVCTAVAALFDRVGIRQENITMVDVYKRQVYDRSVPPAAAVTAFDDFVSAAVGMGVKVLAIAGNHDSPQRLSFANRLVRSEGY